MDIRFLIPILLILISNTTNAQVDNVKTQEMKTKIYVVNSEEKSNESQDYFKLFKDKYNYLDQIELIFQPGNEYEKLQEDLSSIRSLTEDAMLIDTRGLDDRDKESTRLLLTNNFFELSTQKKEGVILHELGHFFTNPKLLEIRRYIAKKNPPKLAPIRPNLQPLINAHNSALFYVFQIPKLLQDVNAELWLFEHERTISESRIKEYCLTSEQPLDEFRNAKVDESFFYQIPKLNSLILWRLATFENLDFDYMEKCFQNTNEVNKLFIKLAATVNLDKLKIFTLQPDLLKSMVYNNEKPKDLIAEFEIIYDEFIIKSVHFFPIDLQNPIIEFYKIND